MSCATISAEVRLRTRRWVPVWQKEQVSVQPTWLDTQSVPRSTSGMYTHSISAPLSSGPVEAMRISHLRVPSFDTCSETTCGRARV